MEYKIREIREVRAVGRIMHTTSVDGENLREIPRFWTRLNEEGVAAEIEKMADPKGIFKGAMLGICMDFSETDETFDYMVGVENSTAPVPEGMEERTFPSQSYAVFRSDASSPDKIQDTWKRIFSEWFPATNYVHVNAPELEVYCCKVPDDPSTFLCDIWIPIALAGNK